MADRPRGLADVVSVAPDDDVLRATLRWMGSAHATPRDDEDLHPARLDLAERDLDLALARREERLRRNR